MKNNLKRIYFDISATTPIDLDVAEYMQSILINTYGNPSSIHREGQASKAIIEKARNQIANALNCSAEEIIFTSSGTESNNMVLKGTLNEGDHLITSSYEHPAILKIIPFLEKNGIEFSLVKPNKNGIVDIESIKDKIKNNTKLISIMYVNNELGTINPINSIGELAKNNNILFHSDAVQAFGKIPIDINKTHINFLSISAHKLYGPKGVGAIYIKNGSILNPLIHGGSQESNLRASTENISGIGGFGMASELANTNLNRNTSYIQTLEESFIKALNKMKLTYNINGINRVPGVFNITLPDLNGQTLVMQLDLEGIGISNGAACSSGTTKASEMLIDLGMDQNEALSTVRISFGKIHNKNQINHFVKTMSKIISKQNNTIKYAK